MEDVFCKNSSAEIQNETTNLKVNNEGLYSSQTIIFSKETLTVSEENLNIIVGEDTDQAMNDYNVSKTLSDCDSPKVSDSVMQKTISPTLIGSAIKVMKNFFSPDKTKSKSTSVLSSINHPKSTSGSPRSSIFIPGKTEHFSSEPETEILKNFQSVPEENLKNPLPMNELGQIQSPFTLDSFNNTDDSFLTTVSLTDESFHSALTHLDEHGDTLKNSVYLMENILNKSRNLDLIDPYIDSFENNQTCLENTTLKNSSFASVGTTLHNASIQSLENLSSIQLGDGNHCQNDSEKVSLTEVQNEEIKINLNETTSKEKYSTNASTEIPISSSLQMKNGQEDCFEKNLIPIANISKITIENENVEMTHLFLSKSFQIPSSFKSNEVCDDGHNLNMIEDEKDPNNFTKNAKVKENDIDFERSSDNQDNFVENCISTTTVVLSTVDSAELDNMLISLKADDSGNNISSLTSLETDDGTCSLENLAKSSLLNTVQSSESCSASAKTFTPLTEDKRSCMSEGNSPNNKTECLKTKLNKSDEFINHKVSCESFNRTLKEKKSSVDTSAGNKLSKISKELPSNDVRVIQEYKYNLPEIDKSEIVHCDQPKSAAVVSQQSYTILSTNDDCLNRPIIESSSTSCDLEKQTFQINQSDATHPSVDMKAEISFMNNLNGSFGTEYLPKSRQPKQSTPLLKENCESPQKIFVSSSSKLFPLESKESVKESQIFFSNEATASLSPVCCDNEDKYPSSVLNCAEENFHCQENNKILSMENSDEQTRNSGEELELKSENFDRTFPIVYNANQTFDVKRFSNESSKVNEKSERNSSSPGCNTKPLLNHQLDLSEHKLNLTYDKNSDSLKSDEIFSKNIELSESHTTKTTFVKHFENNFNQTFDKKTENSEQSKLNETFCKISELSFPNNSAQVLSTSSDLYASHKSNETFVKSADFGSNSVEYVKKERNSFFENNEITKPIVYSAKLESNVEIGDNVSEANKTFQKSNLENLTGKVNLIVGLNSKDFNESFVSTKSSDTFLTYNDLSTVLNNEEELAGNSSIDELSGKLEKMNLNETSEQVAEEQLNDRNIFLESDSNLGEEQNIEAGEKLLNFIKDEKLQCDPDIVQLIQEQFSSKDIEKICSVVQDMPTVKLSNDILKASEEFDKCFHGSLTSVGLKLPDNEITVNQPVNTLSPQSLDFLNSIRGKPTGRDLSRESLYVKFDPLVQPSTNSLIDFTKEAEVPTAGDASSENPHSSSICEQLLTISPQKKPDNIVPPLTPLSHKVKPELSDDKIEKLKELQNEIYFLKNLYAERERTNKTKLEDYESQVAQLTGVSCMLEDKLKESNEREKSLVKKLKEHTQSIDQLKVIMEEYVKVISKLSTELETIKSEKLNQIKALSLEKDSYVTHLQNTEAAFTDVHAKYEKSKKTIVSLKANEIMYRNTIAEQAQKLEDFKVKAKESQEKALIGFQKIEEELSETKASHAQETARLKAQLKKTELKVEALQKALDQKVKENQQLTAICDELIEGKK